MAHPLVLENVWLQQQKFEDAMGSYIRIQSGVSNSAGKEASQTTGSLASEVAAVRQDIQKALSKGPVANEESKPRKNSLRVQSESTADSSVYQRLEALERENKELRKITDDLRALILNVQASVGSGGKAAAAPTPAAAKPAAKPAPPPADSESEDDDEDLFGSDESEDEETKALKEKRLADYAAKKAKKPGPIAKSNIILDVKPWDDETDMKEVEDAVRSIVADGLLWGSAKLVAIGYGIKKLQISCVVEDDKISTDFLEEKITGFEDLVQSMDIAAFNKV